MAFAFLQSRTVSATSPGVLSGITATGVGNLVVVSIRLNSGTATVSSVVDDVGNTYVAATALLTGGSIRHQQWYGVQLIGGATSITVTLSSVVGVRIIAEEFSGGPSSNTGAIRTSSTGIISTSVPTFSPTVGDLVVASYVTSNNVSPWAVGSGYSPGTISQTVNATEYKLSATTSETAPISNAGSGGSSTGLAVAYIPAAVASGVTPSVYMPYLPPFMS